MYAFSAVMSAFCASLLLLLLDRINEHNADAVVFNSFDFVLGVCGGEQRLDGGKVRRSRQLTSTGNLGIAAVSPHGKLFDYVTKERDMRAMLEGSSAAGIHIVLRPEAKVKYERLQFRADGSQVVYLPRGGANRTLGIRDFGGPETKITERADQLAISAAGYLTDKERPAVFSADTGEIVRQFDPQPP